MRILKSKPFARLTKKENISDNVLIEAAKDIAAGNIHASLGKFLVKQRVAPPGKGKSGSARAVVVYVEGERVLFIYLFAKNAKSDLSPPELEAFREAAKQLSLIGLDELVRSGEFTEVK
ncbi:type II toxin-antitoxin system RelE/ParE family toxin [Chthonobacter albigriseus]|uniref:type II toxin-antitoxin system RelE/ParE family toxin n=1 Tax=Chthonobacter albigriseus TaxID=1683161 RepID=UPI0015EFA984|nr:type II toxin-antitoxin system RelE/ParE family toxin [Chthonobacter albigriseus]